MPSDADSTTRHLVDLSSFLNLSKLAMKPETDPAGLAYDDFSFAYNSCEPGTLALLGLGPAGLGLSRRRRAN